MISPIARGPVRRLAAPRDEVAGHALRDDVVADESALSKQRVSKRAERVIIGAMTTRSARLKAQPVVGASLPGSLLGTTRHAQSGIGQRPSWVAFCGAHSHRGSLPFVQLDPVPPSMRKEQVPSSATLQTR
jgi:hypothetical protein